MPDWSVTIRDPLPADETAWRSLWAGYNAFYETVLPETVTARTWQRILDPASPIFARLAVADDDVAGFSICVLHEGTWVIHPMCYLEDLFVAPQFRGQGLGRMLIADLAQRARAQRWSRLYWHTRDSNPARQLYDEFTKADDFVRYRLAFPDRTSGPPRS
ncbi:MAG TPA: GNAT family N-acetyltransferase [Xanthobacteraceae bacterium]|jgi:GNAT superfamily N-acetyltransferase|nr:GNAT family N-acetyltransferase [Xanthobacteraceae bacterium]